MALGDSVSVPDPPATPTASSSRIRCCGWTYDSRAEQRVGGWRRGSTLSRAPTTRAGWLCGGAATRHRFLNLSIFNARHTRTPPPPLPPSSTNSPVGRPTSARRTLRPPPPPKPPQAVASSAGPGPAGEGPGGLLSATPSPPSPWPGGREALEWLYTVGGGGVPLPPQPEPPPPQTIVIIVGKPEFYDWEHLIGPFLVHKLLGPRPPPPPSPAF